MANQLHNVQPFNFVAHKILPLVYDESLSYYEFLCKVMHKVNEIINLIDNGENGEVNAENRHFSFPLNTTNVQPLNFITHHVLPLVYDESLSYYEFLCKVMQKLNEAISAIDDQNEAIEEFDTKITAIGELIKNIVKPFDSVSTSAFSIGSYCLHDNLVYKCVSPVMIGESWDADKWIQVVLATDIATSIYNIESELLDKQNILTAGSGIIIEDDVISATGGSASLNQIVKPFGTTATSAFSIGSYCLHNDFVYRCISPVMIGETWNAAKWTQVVLATDIANNIFNLESELLDKQDVIITDSGGYFTTDTVEGALQELGAAKLSPTNKTSAMTQSVGRDANGKLWTTPGSGGSAVTSVNGQTGDVVITVPTALAQLTSDTSHRTVTDTEKTGWTNKQSTSITDSGGYFTTDTVEGALQELGAAKLSPTSKTSAMTQSVGRDADGKLWTTPGSGGSAVTSVNGKTGDVVLGAEDVGAYVKPNNGIPSSDMTTSVRESLGKADFAQPKTITDEGGYFPTNTVEAALQLLGSELAGINTYIGSGVIE